MTITTKQQQALDDLPKFIPALAADRTDGVPLTLGTELAAVGAGLTPGVVTALKAAATAIATVDAAVTAAPNASDLATAITLVNDLKAKWNAAVPLINEVKTRYNALSNGIDALP